MNSDDPFAANVIDLLARLSPADRAKFVLSLPPMLRQQIHPSGSSIDDPVDLLRPPSRRTRHRARRTPTYYRVRVDLADAKPPIWRRLDLASDLTLDCVHAVLQAAFSWGGHHLHQFSTGHRRDWDAETFTTEFDRAEGDEGAPEEQIRLDHVMTEPRDSLYYSYDFGDGWYHVLTHEQSSRRPAQSPAARVLAGRRAAPPDDCGGMYGYYDLLEALGDPQHPEHESMRAWFEEYGGVSSAQDFDPAYVDLAELDDDVQHALAAFR